MHHPMNLGQASVQNDGGIEDEKERTVDMSKLNIGTSNFDMSSMLGVGIDPPRAERSGARSRGSEERTAIGFVEVNPDLDQDAVISALVKSNQALIEAIANANNELDAANEINRQLFKRYKELKDAPDVSEA